MITCDSEADSCAYNYRLSPLNLNCNASFRASEYDLESSALNDQEQYCIGFQMIRKADDIVFGTFQWYCVTGMRLFEYTFLALIILPPSPFIHEFKDNTKQTMVSIINFKLQIFFKYFSYPRNIYEGTIH